MSEARDRSLPKNVGRFFSVPVDGQCLAVGDARSVRAAKRRPVLSPRHDAHRRQQKKCDESLAGFHIVYSVPGLGFLVSGFWFRVDEDLKAPQVIKSKPETRNSELLTLNSEPLSPFSIAR